jgi:hypothetical protein
MLFHIFVESERDRRWDLSGGVSMDLYTQGVMNAGCTYLPRGHPDDQATTKGEKTRIPAGPTTTITKRQQPATNTQVWQPGLPGPCGLGLATKEPVDYHALSGPDKRNLVRESALRTAGIGSDSKIIPDTTDKT